jgi:hypothetical protein
MRGLEVLRAKQQSRWYSSNIDSITLLNYKHPDINALLVVTISLKALKIRGAMFAFVNRLVADAFLNASPLQVATLTAKVAGLLVCSYTGVQCMCSRSDV